MRNSYSCGGKGRQGTTRKNCTSCGRRHPRGKNQKADAQKNNWVSCKEVAISRNKRTDTFVPVDRDPQAEQKRRAKCERSRQRNLNRKAERSAAAQQRKAIWEKLTPQQQLAALEQRPGNSLRQRARLEKMLGASK